MRPHETDRRPIGWRPAPGPAAFRPSRSEASRSAGWPARVGSPPARTGNPCCRPNGTGAGPRRVAQPFRDRAPPLGAGCGAGPGTPSPVAAPPRQNRQLQHRQLQHRQLQHRQAVHRERGHHAAPLQLRAAPGRVLPTPSVRGARNRSRYCGLLQSMEDCCRDHFPSPIPFRSLYRKDLPGGNAFRGRMLGIFQLFVPGAKDQDRVPVKESHWSR
jgi:hypothetical protein